MKIVIPGGTGHVGRSLARDLRELGHEVVILTRGQAGSAGALHWNGRSLGPWAEAIDGADVVLNLAGRSVSCRYNATNLREMLDSRVDSTRVVGQAIQQSARPPRLWLQMSTATIYAHRFDAPNDEGTGIIGGNEPNVPAYWRRSIEIAQAWEQTQDEVATPETRKVALRTAMVMGPVPGSVFSVLMNLVRLGLGGPVAGGHQFVSWIHERDLFRAVLFLIERDDLTGPINVTSPGPLPQRDFMRILRMAAGVPVGLPATRWMAEIGAFALRTDTELLLKSRRVIPGRLPGAGFRFEYPEWSLAALELVTRWRKGRGQA